jgi:replication-associated recombination protein RarA
MQVLQEILRPKTWEALRGLDYSPIGGISNKEVLKRMALNDTASCLIFEGKPGTGKTSACRLFGATYLNIPYDELKDEPLYKEFNASSDRGIDVIREKVLPLVMASHDSNKRQIIVFEEGDGFTDTVFKALKNIVELYSYNCIFIFTTNDISKFESEKNDAIFSRSTTFHFNPISAKEFSEWFEKASKVARITYNTLVLPSIYAYYKGDLRRVVSDLLIPYMDTDIKDFRPLPNLAKTIMAAADPIKKYLELAKEQYIDPKRLLVDLFEENGRKNTKAYIDAANITQTFWDPVFAIVHVLVNNK